MSRKPKSKIADKTGDPNDHRQRVYAISKALLKALQKSGKGQRADEIIKGIGWFLVCLGNSSQPGALQTARQMAMEIKHGSVKCIDNPAVGLCLVGDQIMDWSVGILNKQLEEKAKCQAIAPKQQPAQK